MMQFCETGRYNGTCIDTALPSLVNWASDTPYLPVGVINVDYRNNRILIELPIEADSGTNRMWMPIDAFRVESGVPA